jgi:Protein of unknown function (DUF3667)
VSHIPLREEKDCLNCGAIVHGRYCHVCGQENVVPKETFWHMVTHFFYDVTHFDSNFFETAKDLLFKPGFLSKQYIAGRRAKYLHPIRMYVFTSAVFFLLFFSLFNVKSSISSTINFPLIPEERQKAIAQLKDLLSKDTANKLLKQGIALLADTSKPVTGKEALEFYGNKHNIISLGDGNYGSQKEYDSVQRSLPRSGQDGWFKRRLMKKTIQINEKYRENPDEAIKKLGESVLHRLPYMLFISLPLFALILRLIYLRRKKFFFADHGVFTIHLYVFTFLLLMVVFGLLELEDATHLGELEFVILLLFIVLLYYLFRAMRNFYGQGWFKTFMKFLILLLFSLIMMLILLTLIFFFSAFTL